jgi:hypothetical protein
LNIKLALENLSDQSKSYGKDTIEIEHILNIVDDGTIEITLFLSWRNNRTNYESF